MTDKKKWLYILAGGVGAIALLFGVGFVMFQTVEAAIDPAISARVERISVAADIASLMAFGPGDGGHPMEGYQEALAEALGISVEELQEAYSLAQEAAIAQAVADGLLSEEQAERFSSFAGRGFRGSRGFIGGGGEFNEFLADALGISVTELESAQEQAFGIVLEKAVEEGTIDQEQADLILARVDIQEYVEEAMSGVYEEAVQNAVADGVISQEIGDRLLSEDIGPFPGRPGFHKGFGGHRGW